MGVRTEAIKARTKRFGLLNDLYQQYSRLRIACAGVSSIYEDGDERDEAAYQQVLAMMATAASKCEALEVFLLKEKEVLTRLMADEDCEARR